MGVKKWSVGGSYNFFEILNVRLTQKLEMVCSFLHLNLESICLRIRPIPFFFKVITDIGLALKKII